MVLDYRPADQNPAIKDQPRFGPPDNNPFERDTSKWETHMSKKTYRTRDSSNLAHAKPGLAAFNAENYVLCLWAVALHSQLGYNWLDDMRRPEDPPQQEKP